MSTLYQLTAAAAQMCTPVPAAAPDGWLDRLDHWQTLAGNGVGGLLGIAGAWIVAVMIRRRDRRVAAGMVLPDVQQLAAAGDALERWLVSKFDIPNSQLPAEQRPVAALNQLIDRRPRLFALHTAVIGQLSDIDARLYSHLFQCEMTHRAFEDGVTAQQALRAAIMEAPMDPMDQSARFRGVPRAVPGPVQLHTDWQLCVEHATLAAYFLDRLVFSSWPRCVQRLRMKLQPNELDRRSASLITTGEPLPQQQPAGTSTPPQA
ncbi:hypothetical protein [Paraburkholderia aspalathi]|uniref:hypothetical protein n=1 Tax=Paraburkholderia aspalathi TaxID=1324617 RepID=UPI001B0D66F9|nr:hypothetical protein [Paraburkholderia aspalathi]CAE6846927.1 hypothetical protein R20943_07383 [Paraburkholderia aspalathi]